MSTSECMEYSQKYANAQSSKDRNEARGELRKQIDLTVAEAVAAERERCANYCDGERLYNTARALRNGKFARPTANGKPDTSEPLT